MLRCLLTLELEHLCREFAGPLVHHKIKSELLPLLEGLNACALNGSHVDKNIIAASVGLDKAEDLLGIVPLNGAINHCVPFPNTASHCALSSGRQDILGSGEAVTDRLAPKARKASKNVWTKLDYYYLGDFCGIATARVFGQR
jgi:hypothetical protein